VYRYAVADLAPDVGDELRKRLAASVPGVGWCTLTPP